MQVLVRLKVRPVPGRLTDSAVWQQSLLIRRDATLILVLLDEEG